VKSENKSARPRARRSRPDLPKIVVFLYALENKLISEIVDPLDALQSFVGVACKPF